VQSGHVVVVVVVVAATVVVVGSTVVLVVAATVVVVGWVYPASTEGIARVMAATPATAAMAGMMRWEFMIRLSGWRWRSGW
jgi:hypothetical protein